MEPFCVVHYDLDIEYSRITELSDKTHKKLLDAKHIRSNSERFGNQHLKQSGSIPCTLDPRIHGIHLECYKKYTQILSKQKVSSGDIDNETISKRPRRSNDEFISSKKTGVVLFPKHCFFCKKIRKKHKGKEYTAHKITLHKAEESIKNAARRKNDHELLLHIDNEDLCSKEFHMHDVCRKDYIRVRTNTRHDKNPTVMQDLEPSKLRSGRLLANDIQPESTEVVNIVNDDEEPVNFLDVEQTFNDLANHNHENQLEIEGKMFDMESVKNEIIQKVFGNGERISIKEIHRLYNDGHQDDRRYRSKLKAKIIEIFGDELRFIQDSHTSPGMICKNISSSSDGISLFDNDKIINEAAKILRNDILKYSLENKPDEWPPNLNVLQKSFEDFPKSVNQFLETLLKDPSHSSSERVKRLIKSYSCDLIHGVTSGKVMTLKHYLIGLGFHNLGGQKSIIRLLSQLGHSVSYDTVTTAETALAELNQLQAESCSSSGLQPKTSDGFVYTYFWADNFNKKVESDKVGMIDSTHMIKFQEKNENSFYQEALFRNIKKNRSKFCPNERVDAGQLVVKPKVDPPNTFLSFDLHESKQEEISFNMRYIIWLIIRHKTSKDALLSNFAGWQLCKRKFEKIDSKKTVTTYLPPINAPVNSFETIYEYLSYMQKICFEANMPYVNVTLDCGAAINAFKLVWNYPSTFDDIVIHLGDFHMMKEVFTVLGILVKGSGFEDIVFQSNLSSSGSLNGIMNGSHYNRCWKVHEHFAEALERLLLDRFLFDNPSINEVTKEQIIYACDGNESVLLTDNEIVNTISQFKNYKQKVREGHLGKTPQFWVKHYLDVVNTLHLIHIAVQESNYDLRLQGYLNMMPYFFGLNLTNYARYGSYYLYQMMNMDRLFPGNKEILRTYGISVQGQDKYPLRTAIDQRGEQTLNRDAKVSGGITSFAVDHSCVSKWTLNRSSTAQITNNLKQFAGIKDSDDVYKHTRPIQIIKSNKTTNHIVDVILNEYINPFDMELDRNKLYNLSSGIPVNDLFSERILQVASIGEVNYNDFVNKRLMANQESFFTPLSRIKISLFSQTGKKVEIISNGKLKTIEANSNVISKLLVISSKLDRKIDMKCALSFPLCNTPMNLAHADGARRTTGKSAFTSILLNECLPEKSLYPQKHEVLSYMVDLMALIRARKSTPSTFKDLIIQIIEMIPIGYKRVDIIADTYRNYSIKDPERSCRGCSEKILVKSHSTQLPRNFDDFLKNGENKQRLIELFQIVLSDSREEILETLKCKNIFFSMDKICYRFSREGEFVSDIFSSNQEEADTKLILHCYHVLSSNPEGSVIIRSHSGDTDINILGASLMIQEAPRVFIDFNTGAYRKVLCLGDLTLNDVEKKALIGIHAFTGNDYVSSFFRKSKKMCWKVSKRNPRFFQTFAELGTSWVPSENLKLELEEYVCLLFETSRSRIKEVNDMRYHLYKKKFEAKEKIIDLSLLPPCFKSLQLHILRSCYVARRYRLSTESNFEEPSILDHGWKENGEIHWVDKAFPDDIERLLVDENIEDEEYVESDDASESSDVEQE